MSLKGSIAKNTAFDSAAQIAVMLFSLVAGIFLARSLGDSGRGAYVLATSFAGGLVLSLTNMGFELSASVMMAKNRRLLSRVHTIVFIGAIVIGAVLWGVVAMLQPFLVEYVLPGLDTQTLWLVFGAMPFWIYQYGCYGILVGLGKIRTRSGYDIAYNFTQSAMVVILLVAASGGGEATVVRYLAFSYYATIVVSSFMIGRTVSRFGSLWRLPTIPMIRQFLGYGFWVHAGNMGGNVGQRVDQYFLQQVSGSNAAFGVYTLATALTQRTRVFPQALSRASYARICSSPEAEAAQLVAACFRQMLALGIVLIAVGALAAPLIPIVYTADFAPAMVPFVIFLFGRLFHNCSWMLANYFTGHLGKPIIPMIVNWAILPAQAVAAFFAVEVGGLVGLALIASLGYALLFTIFLVLFLKWQNHVGLRELFVLTPQDMAPWKAIIARILGRKKR